MTEPGTDNAASAAKPIWQREAWQRFPDAQSAEAAVAGAKLVDGASSRWDNKALSRMFASKSSIDQMKIDVAQSSFEALSDKEKQQLPNSAKTYMSDRLPYTKEGDDVRAKIIASSDYADGGFLAWQEEREAKMLQAMGDDPVIKEGQQRWNDPGFTQNERLAVAEHVHKIQMDSFGGETVPIGLKDDPRVQATYYSQDKKILLSNNPDQGINLPKFDDFIHTVTHESTHAIQDQIVDRNIKLKAIEGQTLDDLGVKSTAELSPEGHEIYNAEQERRKKEAFPVGDENGWNKELGPNGKLVGVAPLFENARHGYMTGTGYNNYSANPVEEHAEEVGSLTAKYIGANEAERKEIISSLNNEAEMDNKVHKMVMRQRDATMSSPSMGGS